MRPSTPSAPCSAARTWNTPSSTAPTSAAPSCLGARLRDAAFVDTRIDESTDFGDRLVYEDELAETDAAEDRVGLYEAARWTYREIQTLASDSGLTRASRGYYLRQKDLRHRFAWEHGSYARALGDEAWRWTTGDGTNP